MTQATMEIPADSQSRWLNIALWAAQILLALAFGMFGLMKLFQPLDQLAVMMKWVTVVSPWFVRALGAAEFLGAVGLILPPATRILPRLCVAAATCFLALQLLAVGLHVSRGEFNVLGLNAVLLALILFVAWGRATAAPIAPR